MRCDGAVSGELTLFTKVRICRVYIIEDGGQTHKYNDPPAGKLAKESCPLLSNPCTQSNVLS